MPHLTKSWKHTVLSNAAGGCQQEADFIHVLTVAEKNSVPLFLSKLRLVSDRVPSTSLETFPIKGICPSYKSF